MEKSQVKIISMQTCMSVRLNNTRTSNGANGIVAYCSVELNSSWKSINKLGFLIWDYNSDLAEYSSILGCDAVSFGEYYPKFRTTVLPSTRGVKRSRYYDLSKRRLLLTQRHGITYQKTWNFITYAVTSHVLGHKKPQIKDRGNGSCTIQGAVANWHWAMLEW
jgi:hypothetical protein